MKTKSLLLSFALLIGAITLFAQAAGPTVPTLGQPVTFTVVTAAGTPPFTFQWKKDGVVIAAAPNAATFTVAAATLELAGSYTAVVSNSAGSTTTSPAVIAFLPQFTTQPQSQTVAIGGTVTLKAGLIGATSLQWRKNGTAITGATSDTLVLATVLPADAALYTLAATNAAGTAISAAASLSVSLIPPSGSVLIITAIAP